VPGKEYGLWLSWVRWPGGDVNAGSGSGVDQAVLAQLRDGQSDGVPGHPVLLVQRDHRGEPLTRLPPACLDLAGQVGGDMTPATVGVGGHETRS